jgi:hypothetical protein
MESAHVTPEEVAAYANRSLTVRAEHEIDKHVATCDHCLYVLINALWDQLERSAKKANGSAGYTCDPMRASEAALSADRRRDSFDRNVA